MPPVRKYAATESEIAGLLASGKKYAVPAHQRNYEWEENQVIQFWTDCADIANGTNDRLFIGTIVLNSDADPDVEGRLNIIDGQQRLATATMMACVLYRRAQKLKDEGVAIHPEGKLKLLGEPDMMTGILTPNLLLNLADRAEFSGLIGSVPPMTIAAIRATAKEKSPSGRTKFFAAYVILYDKLEELLNGKTPAQQAELIFKFFAALEKTSVIEVTVVDDAAAYDLFETLNDRGLPLSLVDLLKNHLFRNAGTGIAGLKQAWLDFEGKFTSRKDVPSFVTFVWRATEGKVRRHELFRRIKAKYTGEVKCSEFVNLLKSFSEKYIRLDNPEAFDDWAENTKSQTHASHLALLGTRQWYPLAMAAMLKLPDDQIEKVLNGLVKFTVRYTVIGERQPTYLEEGFSDIALKVWRGEYTTWGQIRTDLKKISQYPSDTEFANAFATARPTPKEVRYLLMQLESHLRKEAYDQKYLTIEHVLPETPFQAEWDAEYFRDPDHLESYQKRLGNLILLPRGKNKDVRNSPYAAKRPVYADSELLLAKELAKSVDWKPTDMAAWGTKLGEMALQIWSLD